MQTSDDLADDGEKTSCLRSPVFLSYLGMSFLTAVNDSMFRWLVVPIAKALVAREPGLSAAEIQSREAGILAGGLACFMIPFVVFAPISGWLADRYAKRSAIIGLKIAEFLIMLAGLAAISQSSLTGMFVILFLMGTQSALLSTSKFGIIPELVPRSQLSHANGYVGLITLIAVIAGTVAGNLLAEMTGPVGTSRLWISAAALLGTAALGVVSAFPIRSAPAAAPTVRFPWNPVTSIIRDLKLTAADRAIFRVTLGIAFFWSLAALAQLNIDTFVTDALTMGQSEVGLFLAVLSVGVGAGSVLAGKWSGGRVELGMVPLGNLLMALACGIAWLSGSSPVLFGMALAGIGIGGGLFSVPLNAFIQDRSPRASLGAILAAGNLLTAIGTLGVSAVFPLLRGNLQLSSEQVFLVTGLGTLPVLLYTLTLIPQATIRFLMWLMTRLVYRVRVVGTEQIPSQGGALLVANHVSWIDGVLILLSGSRPIRMVAYADYVTGGLKGWLASLFGIIPIRASDGPRALMQSLNEARDALKAGELVCLFAEGRISRSGQLLKFEKGMLKILKGTDAPVIPVYLDELWGSVFSYRGGRVLWKSPRELPYPVTILFGNPISDVSDVHVVRNAVLDLGVLSQDYRKQRRMIPAVRYIRQCRSSWSRLMLADSAGTALSGGKSLIGGLAFRRVLLDGVLDADESHVGLLLPPSVGGALANIALSLAGRVTVNLNYTMTDDTLNYCIREAGIRRVLTSRKFVEKKPVQLDAELVFLEDLKEKITTKDRILSLLAAKLMPFGMLIRRLGLDRLNADDVLSIIFTSGSTGQPKGVMLSHNNVASNVDAVNDVLDLKAEDTLIGVLPFFHSFGYTITLWLPLCTAPATVFHFNPLDARTVSKLCRRHSATIIAATPTFLRTYLKRCDREDLKTLNLVIVGAEKLPDALRDSFADAYGFEPTEGYGTTELSPVASFNVPESRMSASDRGQTGSKQGSVGRVIPGAAAAVFDPDTGESLPPNSEGLLRIKGPNVMLGYLNQPEKTAKVLKDGWYDTGDMARIDEDGFIFITGRMSRFSKIGGEMVPHILIEQKLTEIIDDDDTDEPEILVAVTAVPDEKKGERLIVLHKPTPKPVADLIAALKADDLPNLWIPGADSFFEVASIPLLGTGKLDLQGVKIQALELTGRNG